LIGHAAHVPDAEFTIVRAVASDADAVHALKMRAFAEEGRLSGSTEIPPLLEDRGAVERDIREHTVLVAMDDGQVVGSARGVVSGNACEIRAVCVDPSRQGRGLGRALVRAVEEAHPDVERFELTTNTVVPGNVEFYERQGYRVTGTTQFTDRIVLARLSKAASTPTHDLR
jgi:predicted N-acetyltransferase YhbS